MVFTKIGKHREYETWKYIPDLVHAFPFHMEPMTLSHRIRCVFEYFYGYRIYYFKYLTEWVGYCVVSSGRNRRYAFSTKDDIIFGRYYVDEEFRGNNVSLELLKYVLDEAENEYTNAYAYVNDHNTASNKIMNKLGTTIAGKFYIKGLFRHLVFDPSGDYTLYRYNRGT